MATVTGLTAERMLAIEGSSVIDGDIVNNNLILTKHDGTTIDAGRVTGPVGPQGPVGPASSPIPTGGLLDFAGPTPPTGYVLCDGTSYLTSAYPALFAVIGYGYGGAGSSFNVPDFRGRVTVGKGVHADVDSLGDNEGSLVANRSPKHKHTITDPGHSHEWFSNRGSGAHSGIGDGATYFSTPEGQASGNSAVIAPAVTAITATPGGTPPDHTPAYGVVNKIIKT